MYSKVMRIIAAAVLLLAVDMIFEVSFPVVRKVDVYTEKLESGNSIRLLQISDLHGSPRKELVDKMIKQTEGVRPDAIVITGDLVDQATTNYKNVYSLIEKLYAVCPNIFFVAGNHEGSNAGYERLKGKLRDVGAVILNNKAATFKIRNTVINICGVDDPYRGKDNIEKSMKKVDESKFTVLLSHSPRIRGRLGKHVPDLILCGHTHGGQIRLPFIGAVIAPGEGLFPHYDKGMFKLKNGSHLYIDSGVGTSTLPIRFLNRSQMSLIRINGR